MTRSDQLSREQQHMINILWGPRDILTRTCAETSVPSHVAMLVTKESSSHPVTQAASLEIYNVPMTGINEHETSESV